MQEGQRTPALIGQGSYDEALADHRTLAGHLEACARGDIGNTIRGQWGEADGMPEAVAEYDGAVNAAIREYHRLSEIRNAARAVLVIARDGDYHDERLWDALASLRDAHGSEGLDDSASAEAGTVRYFSYGEIDHTGGFHSRSSQKRPNRPGWFVFEAEHCQWAGPYSTRAEACAAVVAKEAEDNG